MSHLCKNGQNCPLSLLIFTFFDQCKVSGCSFKHHDIKRICNINCIIESTLFLIYIYVPKKYEQRLCVLFRYYAIYVLERSHKMNNE